MNIPYTSDRSGFLGWVMGWGLLFLVEGLVVVTLIMVFVPVLWLKLALTGAFILLLGWFINTLFRPLRSEHVLDETTLGIRYGAARINIPRSQIAYAEATSSHSGAAYVGVPTPDEASDTLRVTFSRQGQILLHLDPPLDIPLRKSVYTAHKILINADNRDDVLNALNDEIPQQPSVTTTLPPLQSAITHDIDSQMVAIEAIGLSKSFGEKVAVEEIDLRIHAGEIYGFIGPNGAGKTTTLSMLVGLLAPTNGIIRIAGHDLSANSVSAKEALGYVPDRPILYDTLTGRENLEFIAQMRRLSREDASDRIDHLLTTLDIRHRADELARTYSFGMRNKLSLAAAMLHRPQVLILDEPFNGLDPQTSYSLRTLIIEQAAQGTCVLLSTHDLGLVERMCYRVGVIDRGRLIAEGEPDAIRHQAGDLEAAFLTLIGTGPPR